MRFFLCLLSNSIVTLDMLSHGVDATQANLKLIYLDMEHHADILLLALQIAPIYSFFLGNSDFPTVPLPEFNGGYFFLVLS